MPRRLALVIEDSDDTRELYALALRLDGYVVAQARDGRAGLQQARDLVPGVIITDLAMPIMDGWEMTRRLRADPRTRHIPIIACSARDDTRHRADASAPDVVLTKPFAFDLLLVEARHLLQQRAA
jgi:two-component system, cell cycle response regulator DivK